MNKNLLGIDFEDWFHPELVQKYISKENHEPKIINGIEKILELLRKKECNATFFVVGELLESKPELLDLILDNGHEIIAHVSGKMRMHYIKLLPGDKVKLEMSPYDLSKGRITFRY